MRPVLLNMVICLFSEKVTSTKKLSVEHVWEDTRKKVKICRILRNRNHYPSLVASVTVKVEENAEESQNRSLHVVVPLVEPMIESLFASS